ncbi:hypothetical protein KDX16_15955 [Burkholderia vietnamiensis]|jgi:hypothetical protein|uniref:Uncharacterized protein n=1 Tax=Burkholderia aenigmatica TaxID=2015348 RepID=A0A6P2LT73_9BURK|nr:MULTISPECIES: hypothetical protein [Burkholderia]HDR9761885.1 hypothetical protein [Burkholderia cepacia ATCC 25416]MBR7917318.1 hypothetical protein [Burkholderia vietnamiensis]MBR8055223.1 hypothetical protein [Burkholderia vietnamiensis]VWB72502.1 hypothetical protein BLA13014_03296 [Burkholderia aenigmatica]HDR9791991.1 hypothetical protein [Burkholderia cepacia ATCC 25416]
MKNQIVASTAAVLLLFAAGSANADPLGVIDAPSQIVPAVAAPANGYDVVVMRRDARGAISDFGERQTHGESVNFGEQFNYLVATNGPRDGLDGYRKMAVSDIQSMPFGLTTFRLQLEEKDSGSELTVNRRVWLNAGEDTAVVHGLNGQDYLVKLRRVDG